MIQTGYKKGFLGRYILKILFMFSFQEGNLYSPSLLDTSASSGSLYSPVKDDRDGIGSDSTTCDETPEKKKKVDGKQLSRKLYTSRTASSSIGQAPGRTEAHYSSRYDTPLINREKANKKEGFKTSVSPGNHPLLDDEKQQLQDNNCLPEAPTENDIHVLTVTEVSNFVGTVFEEDEAICRKFEGN